MSGYKERVKDRILAVLLAIVMLTGIMPVTVSASTTNNPNAFTFTIKDYSGNGIDGASIAYDIQVNSVSAKTGSVTTVSGEAVIADMADYADTILAGVDSVSIGYIITKDGYTDVSGSRTVNNAQDNIDAVMLESAPGQATITVTKSGDGTIKLNGTETNTETVDKNSSVAVELTPAAGSYIKSLTVAGTVTKVNKGESYSTTITADADKTIDIAFVKYYTVGVSQNESGTVKLDGNELTSAEYDENSNMTLSIVPDAGYQIASVFIGGTNQSISDVTNFSNTFTVTADTLVSVSFVKVYTIFIHYNSNGTVVTNPACTAGKVTVNINTVVDITATPETNYRVAKVVINNNTDEELADNTYYFNSDTDKNPYTKTLTADQDYTVAVTFAPLVYNVTVFDVKNGTVTTDKLIVDYNGKATITVAPANGYNVDSVTVNGQPLSALGITGQTIEGNKFEFYIENIIKDQTITVAFAENNAISLDYVDFNAEDAIAGNGKSVYVFAKDKTVSFSTTKDGLQINGKNTSTVSSTTVITRIQINEKWLIFDSWSDVTLPSGGLKIVIDDVAPAAEITPETAHCNDYYNDNVFVEISADDANSKVGDTDIIGSFSGIAQIEYWVTCDGAITQGKGYDNNGVTDDGLIFRCDGVCVENTVKRSITVDTANGKNNSDAVTVYVKVTDRAGNSYETQKELKINTTPPEIYASIGGTLHPEAEQGYYNSERKATITFTDRSDTFVKADAVECIKINGESAKTADVAWTDLGSGKYEASVTFDQTNRYTFEVDPYTNQAGLTSNKPIISGDSAAEFTIDRESPTGSIAVESTAWDDIIKTLTFGIWKNDSVVVSARGSDATSPLYDITYYKSNSTTALTKDELIALYENDNFTAASYTINSDERFAVYARITDYAGNTLYIGTNGLIVDLNPSSVTITAQTEPNKAGFYTNNRGEEEILFDVSVIDPEVSGSYSGIKTIEYQVICDDVITQGKGSQDDGQGLLYRFDYDIEKDEPLYSDLRSEWDGTVAVSFAKNNGKTIFVNIIVTDNAGNAEEYQSERFSINKDIPKIHVSVDAEVSANGKAGYYQGTRIATVVITDREYSFTAQGVSFTFSALDVSERPYYDDNDVEKVIVPEVIGWNHNGDTHTALVKFTEDANYKWSVSYENKAEKKNDGVTSDGDAVFEFTLDNTDPAGKVTVAENTWDTLLRVLTFGLYSNVRVDVTAAATDATSPVTIEYYKTDNAAAMTADELDNADFSEFTDFSMFSDEQFVVYLKITDYAGNYIYIGSDGYIVDMVKSSITLTPDEPNANGLYNDDVDVAISIVDAAPYSGIKSVEYWVETDHVEMRRKTLFTFDTANPKQADLVNEWSDIITVTADDNNSCNVVVYVKTVDNAGNENTKSVPLDIDVTAPVIDLTYDNNTDNNSSGYFDAARTATVVITERTHHFDASAATKSILITAVDAKGQPVAIDTASMISSWTTLEGATPDAARHTATISYNTDANYSFEISYTDKAGNDSTAVNTYDSVTPYSFTVDTSAPIGTVSAKSAEGRETTWNKLTDSLTFGFWSGQKITITGTSDDSTSPVDSVLYYKTSDTKAMTVSDLNAVTDWTDFVSLSVAPNEQFAVYIKITDKAGNVAYISTDGMIADDTAPREEVIAPEITLSPEQPINGLYNRDVKVSIKVDDPLVGGTYSGLKTITYRVLNMGVETQNGKLYSFADANPTRDKLLKTWTGEITVDSEKNNSNDVMIEIYAEDNALNSSKDDVSIKIDVTTPAIDISYNNNAPDSEKYYMNDRVATIVITERNFNAGDVKVSITNTDGVIPEISNWKTVSGSENQDNTKHTATITYHADGDYVFAIEYTDLADNKCAGETYAAGTANPTEFTVDRTLPVISVSYNNNSAQNGKYFNAHRTATIVVTEHNFDVSRVRFAKTASLDGASVTAPTASWSSNGDVHTATIPYTADGDYTFDVSMTDMAGNQSAAAGYGNSVAGKDFTIDTNIDKPIITGVENGKSYKNEVVPVISFKDVNFESYEVQLLRTRKAEKGVDVTNQFINSISTDSYGGTGSNDTFEKIQDNDGIYTLKVTMTDKAGNTDAESIVFTVNRFGSVYAFNDYLISLRDAYIQTVDKELSITEYNPDRLVSGSLQVQITCDGNPISDVAYTVTPVINDIVAIGESGWYQYKYVIDTSNFEKDGIYKLVVSSEDVVGNKPETTNYDEYDVLFRVDTTKPEITNITGLENAIVNASGQDVVFNVFDAIGLKKVAVYVDGSAVRTFDRFDDLINFNGAMAIEEGSNQKVRFVAEDLAGNILDTDEKDGAGNYLFNPEFGFCRDITVSTNLFVRWYVNKPLFLGSIGIVMAVGMGLSLLLFLRNRKKKESQ
jgi:hypothetical protein